MQADARLVQDVHGAHQAGAQRCHEVDALALAAGQGVAGAVQRQVAQAYVHDALQTGYDLRDGLRHDAALGVRKRRRGEEVEGFLRRHLQDVVDVAATDLHPEGLPAQAAAAARGAGGPAAEAAEHVFELDLVALGLHPGEEIIDADEAGLVALDVFGIPDKVFDLT